MFFWNWGIGLVIGTAVWLYTFGWLRQRSDTPHSLLPRLWQMSRFVTAMLLLTLTLFSPIHTLATRYFYIHVLQRLLLIAVIPSLFFSGDPLRLIWAGLPTNLQTRLRHLRQTAPRFCQLVTQSTTPVAALFLFVTTYWLWHDKQINQLLLQTAWVHRLENITLLGTAVFYWWHIMAAWPSLHKPMPALWRVAYAALGAAPIKLVGLVLLFTSTAVYQYPAEITLSNLDITDQSAGAAIVWTVGGIVFTWTAVWLMRTWLQDEEKKPTLPESIWSSEELMLAPGFSKSSSYLPPPK